MGNFRGVCLSSQIINRNVVLISSRTVTLITRVALVDFLILKRTWLGGSFFLPLGTNRTRFSGTGEYFETSSWKVRKRESSSKSEVKIRMLIFILYFVISLETTTRARLPSSKYFERASG